MDNIAFCFIVKDGEEYLQKNIEKIMKFADSHSLKYNFFYAENDSTDSTIRILKKYNFKGEHLLLDGKHSTDLCDKTDINCRERTRRLAYLRNTVLNMAKGWESCEYICMLDMDFIDFNENELYKMFNIIKNNPNINGIFGMSVTEYGFFYDIGAVRPFGKIIDIMSKDKLVPVESAFSGFGIYRMKVLRDENLEYNTQTNEIEHIDFNKKIDNLYVYTSFRPVYDCIKYTNFMIINAIKIFIILIFMILCQLIYHGTSLSRRGFRHL